MLAIVTEKTYFIALYFTFKFIVYSLLICPGLIVPSCSFVQEYCRSDRSQVLILYIILEERIDLDSTFRSRSSGDSSLHRPRPRVYRSVPIYRCCLHLDLHGFHINLYVRNLDRDLFETQTRSRTIVLSLILRMLTSTLSINIQTQILDFDLDLNTYSLYCEEFRLDGPVIKYLTQNLDSLDIQIVLPPIAPNSISVAFNEIS